VGRALALQADKAKPWAEGWGDLVEAAQVAGKLPADKWQQYAAGTFELTLEVRPEVRRGDPLPYWLGRAAPRAGSRTVLSLSFGVTRADSGGKPIDSASRTSGTFRAACATS
jgi:hypothetical protein